MVRKLWPFAKMHLHKQGNLFKKKKNLMTKLKCLYTECDGHLEFNVRTEGKALLDTLQHFPFSCSLVFVFIKSAKQLKLVY